MDSIGRLDRAAVGGLGRKTGDGCAPRGSRGVKPRQPWYFWPAAQTVFGILLILLVVGNRKYPAFMEDLGLSAGESWFIFLWLAFSMVVAGLRMRRRGHDGADDSSG